MAVDYSPTRFARASLLSDGGYDRGVNEPSREDDKDQETTGFCCVVLQVLPGGKSTKCRIATGANFSAHDFFLALAGLRSALPFSK
jgi:hypothetical protein